MKVFVGSLLGILTTWMEFCSWHDLLTFPPYSLFCFCVETGSLAVT